MSGHKVAGIVCRRVGESKSCDAYMPTHGGVQLECSECKHNVWMAKSTQDDPRCAGIKVSCIQCFAKSQDRSRPAILAEGCIEELKNHQREIIESN